MTKIAFFDGSYGHLAVASEDGYVNEVVTTAAHPDRYIRVDDGCQYPQLCAGGGRRGNTLTWASNEAEMGKWFAKDCGAKLYKSRAGYDRAIAALRA